MATRNRTPSVDPYQSVVDVQAMLSYVACAVFESGGEELDFGPLLDPYPLPRPPQRD